MATEAPKELKAFYNPSETLQLISKTRAQVATIRNASEQLVEDVTGQIRSNAKAQRFLAISQQLSSVFQELQPAALAVHQAGSSAEAALQQLAPQEWEAAWRLRSERERQHAIQRQAKGAIAQLDAFSTYPPSLCSRASSGDHPAVALQAVVEWAAKQTGHVIQLRSCMSGQTKTCESPAHCTHVEVQVSKSLVASVALQPAGRPSPLRVVVSSPPEGLSPWGLSRHLVCRRVSAVAMSALQHFQKDARDNAVGPGCGGNGCTGGNGGAGNRAAAAAAAAADIRCLESILLWLTLYKDLYSKPSSATGQLLVTDTSRRQLLPPVMRPYRLSRAKLLDLAQGRAPPRAYHVQDAPLDWEEE